MATYYVSNPGNTAIQQEVWMLTMDEAKQAIAAFDTRLGTYWHSNLMQPYRRAWRKDAETVRIYTSGFSTGELSNVLCATGATVAERKTF